jgi:hypothetical protein
VGHASDDARVTGLAVGASGVVLTGAVRGDLRLDPAHFVASPIGFDTFVAELDRAGAPVRVQVLGSEAPYPPESRVALNSRGGVRLAGSFAGMLAVPGGPLHAPPGAMVPYLVALSPPGNARTLSDSAEIQAFERVGDTLRVGLKGYTPLDLGTGSPRTDGTFLAAFDEQGGLRWVVPPLPGEGEITGLTHDPAGAPWISGHFLRDADPADAKRTGRVGLYNSAIVALSAEGAVVHTRRFGTDRRSVFVQALGVSRDRIVLTGTAESGTRIDDFEVTDAAHEVAFISSLPR